MVPDPIIIQSFKNKLYENKIKENIFLQDGREYE